MSTILTVHDFETKLHQLHAFSLLASSECFLELDGNDQLSCLHGISCLTYELKNAFYRLSENNSLNLN